jgi:hypothetical protein
VIHVASEFSRSARVDGSGSDHAFEGAVTSVWSGAIQKPIVLGNIRQNASVSTARDPVYAGTWGGAAPVTLGSTSGPLGIGNVAHLSRRLRVARLRIGQPALVAGSATVDRPGHAKVAGTSHASSFVGDYILNPGGDKEDRPNAVAVARSGYAEDGSGGPLTYCYTLDTAGQAGPTRELECAVTGPGGPLGAPPYHAAAPSGPRTPA